MKLFHNMKHILIAVERPFVKRANRFQYPTEWASNISMVINLVNKPAWLHRGTPNTFFSMSHLPFNWRSRRTGVLTRILLFFSRPANGALSNVNFNVR